jgi:hypothetical protein
MSRATLLRLAELEQRYDGPVPDALRQAAHVGSAAAVEELFAIGEAKFYRALAKKQIALIRRRRADGTFYPALISDLQFYRTAWREWHSRCRALRAAERPRR